MRKVLLKVTVRSACISRPRRRETMKWRRGSPAIRRDRGHGWTALEEPLEVAAALLKHARAGRVVVVDCLTLWLTNLMLAGRDPGPSVTTLGEAIRALAGPAILVSNEVGMGIVPTTSLDVNFATGRAGRTGK